MPEFEDLNAALVECVKAAGGSKVVGHALWPSKGVDAAQRHLLACLNESKPERLAPDDVLHVARLARAKGCHAYARYVAQDLSYAEPQPVEPNDELADLMRQYLARREQDAAKDERLQRMLAQHLGLKAAA